MTKKRNKAYRPRHVQSDPVSWAIAGVHTLPAEQQRKAMQQVDAAVLLLKQAKATRDDWNVIHQALNIAKALADLQIGANLLQQINSGEHALRDIAGRMALGKTACYGYEIALIDEAVSMYQIQLRLCTQAEFQRAVKRVRQLVMCGAMDDTGRLYEQMVC
jgi:hypothetical protein